MFLLLPNIPDFNFSSLKVWGSKAGIYFPLFSITGSWYFIFRKYLIFFMLIRRNYSLNLVSVRSLSNQPFLLFISYKLLQLFNSTKFAKCCDASNSNNFQTYLLVGGNIGIISVFLIIFKCFPERGRKCVSLITLILN